ncbi:hypothetical protein [Mycobacterium xenopi]|uniref:Uncharacterized protein n=1 Tax=Mycobacterium xenopi TaxID=1789 RepID=A0AAD1LZB8_MYCXE|nr:hypothetical protein [Mycobacterium xenopi]MDA3641625.1 hypothetical protein [Mycobacterium xenopi]MDA3659383.1 hypothetical protein [Mycobacterium xenopi]MDA3663865.1 hypothetical protein [Mycobacterium xenopi]ORX13435.1 hypothetical protein AWC32_15440 [Mycobacterium xenopi]SPX79342.1 Uncharacterised protein [Mycobacterium xenopi]
MTVTDDRHTDPRPTQRTDSSTDDALSVQTLVVEDRGRWAVDIVVVFADGIVRKRIDTYHTRTRAELSARIIQQSAERDLQGPLNG